MPQDQEQLSYWLCPGCSADAREKERRQKLEMMRAASQNTAAVKLAAVKLPEDGEGEEDEEDGDDDEGAAAANGGGAGAGKGEEREKPGNENNTDSQSETKATAMEKSSSEAGAEKGTQQNAAGVGGGPGRTQVSEPKGEDSPSKQQQPGGDAWPKDDMPAWQGLGALGSNALPEGTGLGADGARRLEDEKQNGPGRRDASAVADTFAVVGGFADPIAYGNEVVVEAGSTATAAAATGDAGAVAGISDGRVLEGAIAAALPVDVGSKAVVGGSRDRMEDVPE